MTKLKTVLLTDNTLIFLMHGSVNEWNFDAVVTGQRHATRVMRSQGFDCQPFHFHVMTGQVVHTCGCDSVQLGRQM